MSENTGPMTVSNERMNGARIGSAGLPLAGCELKIEHSAGRDKIGEGEICFRGRVSRPPDPYTHKPKIQSYSRK